MMTMAEVRAEEEREPGYKHILCYQDGDEYVAVLGGEEAARADTPYALGSQLAGIGWTHRSLYLVSKEDALAGIGDTK